MGIVGAGGAGDAGRIWESRFTGKISDPELTKIIDALVRLMNLAEDPDKGEEYQKAVADLRQKIETYAKDLPGNVREALEKLPDIFDKWNDSVMGFYNASITLKKLKNEGASEKEIAEMEAFKNDMRTQMRNSQSDAEKNFSVVVNYSIQNP